MAEKRKRYSRRTLYRGVWPAETQIVLVTCRDCGAVVNGHERHVHDAFHTRIDAALREAART